MAAAEIEVAQEVVAPNPTIKIIVKIKTSPTTNHVNEVQNIRTYLPMQGGPVLSIGRKVAKLLIVAILWSVNGSAKWLQGPQPTLNLIIEKSASLVIIQILTYKTSFTAE